MAHKAWLSTSCILLDQIFQNHLQCPDDIVTVLVPDFKVQVVRNFLTFFYTGSVNCDELMLKEVKKFGLSQLGFQMEFGHMDHEKADRKTNRTEGKKPNFVTLTPIKNVTPNVTLTSEEDVTTTHSTPTEETTKSLSTNLSTIFSDVSFVKKAKKEALKSAMKTFLKTNFKK
jgi:hypothetical protein